MRESLDTLLSDIKGSWRFRWLAMGTASLICLVGWLSVYSIPDTYESEAIVIFETTSDLEKLLQSMTVNADMLSRVETMRTAMLGRQSLEQVVQETGLDQRQKGTSPTESAIASLRSNIEITSNQQRGANIYAIKYRDAQPEMAKSVVATLLNTFVEGTLGASREESRRTQEFLRREIASLEADLTEAEQRLAEFKRENVGRMPGKSGDYFDRLQAEMNALEVTQSKLRQANRQLEALEQRLGGDEFPIGVGGPLADLDKRIMENEQRLEELRIRFTEIHPDIVAVREAIAQLREQRENAVASVRESGSADLASDNPVLQNIQIEVAKVNAEIASLREQERTQQNKIREYRELIDILPQVEAQLARLNREYDVEHAQYRALLQKLEVAELSDAAGQSGEIKFQVIDPPREPLQPVAPQRPLLLAGVLLLGVAVGGGLAFLRNLLNPVFHSTRAVNDVTNLPVLGSVARIESSKTRQRRRLEIGAFGAATVMLCTTFLIVVYFDDAAGEMMRMYLARMVAA